MTQQDRGNKGNEQAHWFAGLAECFELRQAFLYVSKVSLFPENLLGCIDRAGPNSSAIRERQKISWFIVLCMLSLTVVNRNLIVGGFDKRHVQSAECKCRVRKSTIRSLLWYRQENQSSSSDYSSSHNPNKRIDPAAHPVLRQLIEKCFRHMQTRHLNKVN